MLINKKELALELSVSISTINNKMKKGNIKWHKEECFLNQ